MRIAALTLVFFAIFFVRQPTTTSGSSGWGELISYENNRHLEEINAIQTRFHARVNEIQQLQQKNPGNSRLIQQSLDSNGKRFTTEMDACNMRWMQSTQSIQRNVLITTLLMGTAYLMLFLSIFAFTAKFFSHRVKHSPYATRRVMEL